MFNVVVSNSWTLQSLGHVIILYSVTSVWSLIYTIRFKCNLTDDRHRSVKHERSDQTENWRCQFVLLKNSLYNFELNILCVSTKHKEKSSWKIMCSSLWMNNNNVCLFLRHSVSLNTRGWKVNSSICCIISTDFPLEWTLCNFEFCSFHRSVLISLSSSERTYFPFLHSV